MTWQTHMEEELMAFKNPVIRCARRGGVEDSLSVEDGLKIN